MNGMKGQCDRIIKHNHIVAALEAILYNIGACYRKVEDVQWHHDEYLTWADTTVPSPWQRLRIQVS